MGPHFGWAGRFATSAVVALALLTAACAHRYYDADHDDYHRWNNGERVYYNQWIVETHRDDRDYRHLSREDQKRYWDWRHNHDHDRDHDRDRH